MSERELQHWFYLLAEDTESARLHHAARLAEKARQQGDTVGLYCEDDDQASALDDMLWGFRPEAFLPHERLMQSGDQCATGVGIFCHEPNTGDWQTLIVLSSRLPADSTRFPRLALIASSDPEVLQQAREQFRQLKQQGVTPRVLDLRSPHV
ncbi:MAG: DNA polymerase III subunit chi [Halomonadaceae bacterium]|nr:MAG: DNA polymerase III subunit chi [Halomonadaceae bacterium]